MYDHCPVIVRNHHLIHNFTAVTSSVKLSIVNENTFFLPWYVIFPESL